jgi:hypothetical protein
MKNLLNTTKLALIYFDIVMPGRYDAEVYKDRMTARTHFGKMRKVNVNQEALDKAMGIYMSLLLSEVKNLHKEGQSRKIKKVKETA